MCLIALRPGVRSFKNVLFFSFFICTAKKPLLRRVILHFSCLIVLGAEKNKVFSRCLQFSKDALRNEYYYLAIDDCARPHLFYLSAVLFLFSFFLWLGLAWLELLTNQKEVFPSFRLQLLIRAIATIDIIITFFSFASLSTSQAWARNNYAVHSCKDFTLEKAEPNCEIRVAVIHGYFSLTATYLGGTKCVDG